MHEQKFEESGQTARRRKVQENNFSQSTEEKSQSEQEGVDIEEEDEEFSVLEQDYKATLQDLAKNESLASFKSEYERLFTALRRAHERGRLLQEQNSALQAQIEVDSARVAAAIKLSENDRDTIEQLKQELQKAWRVIDTAHDREQAAIDTIENLRHQVAQQGSRKDSVEGLSTDKGQLVKECEGLRSEVARLEEQLLGITSSRDQLLERQHAVDHHLAEMAQELETQSNELAREVRLKEKLELEMREVSEKLARKMAELSGLQFELQEAQRSLARLNVALKENEVTNENLVRDNEALHSRLQKLQADHQVQTFALDSLVDENTKRTAELKVKEARVAQLEGLLSRAKHAHERLRRRVHGLDSKRQSLLQRIAKQKMATDTQKRELQLLRQEMVACQRERSQLARKSELLSNNLAKAHSSAQEQSKMMQLQELSKRSLEMELERCVSDTAKLRKQVSALEAERDKHISQSLELKTEVDKTAEDLKLKQLDVFENMKKIAETETKLKKQQNLYDAVRADRNSLSQNLLESQAETAEMKRKLKMMGHQIEQMKEDITHKESQLIKEEFALQKAQKEREGLRGELQRLQQDVLTCQRQIQQMQLEERKLQRAVQQGDEERHRQQKEIQQIMNERDILGTQLVRRNDELALVYEKERILQTTLSHGQAQYDQRLYDIRLLKLEVKRLRREKGLLVDSVTNSTDLRQEVFHLQRDLAREQTKCRALEEELQSPLNVHRWRKLEGSDPSRYELLQKVQLLQRRLVAQANVAVERESKLRELDRMYQGEHPGRIQPEERHSAQLLHRTQTQLRNKQRRMKGLLAELDMCESQVFEYKTDLEKVTHELNDIKKKYYTEKRQRQMTRERSDSNQEVNLSGSDATEDNTRQFIGGGFNLSATPTKITGEHHS